MQKSVLEPPKRKCGRPKGISVRPGDPRRGAYKKPLVQRFWEKINKTENCWLWTGKTLCPPSYPYGLFRLPKTSNVEPKTKLAHRFSWELHFGTIPEKIKVCHTCDNPRCVRPDHLFLGTQNDNIQDAVQKKRHGFGERNCQAKLTAQQVVEIRERVKTESRKNIAKVFEIDRSTISNIVRGRTWKLI